VTTIFLGTFATWQAFEGDWNKVLNNHDIATFHAADDKNNDELMQDVSQVADKHSMWLFGTTHRFKFKKGVQGSVR
jgi:hypothetical protein